MRNAVLCKGFIEIRLPGLIFQLPDAFFPVSLAKVGMLGIIRGENLLEKIPEYHVRRQPIGIGSAINQVMIPDHVYVYITAIILLPVGTGKIV